MRTLWPDLRYALRLMARNPGFTLTAIITLALGVGANTAIFSVVNAVLLRPLPYADEERLVFIQQTRIDRPDGSRGASYLNFKDWQAQSRSFESMAIIAADETTLTGEGEPVRVRGAVVSSEFFKTLGIAAKLGRTFNAEDDLPGAGGGFGVVMVTDACWRNRFGGDPKIIGRKVTLGEQSLAIVGVTPPGIFPVQSEPVEFWATAAVNGDPARSGTANASRGYPAYLGVLARLKPGVAIDEARSEMETIARGLQEQYRNTNARTGVVLMPLRDLLVGDVRSMLWLLAGVVGTVLLVACVNVANLLLARATSRQREIAIRTALGAGRRHIVQQLLGESLLLAIAGGVVGLLLSMWLLDGLMALLPADIPRLTGLAPDWRVLLFTFGAALGAGVVCGLAPALTAMKVDLTEAIKEGGRTASGGRLRTRLRQALIVGQIAAALVLLVGAGLLIRSLIRLQQVNPGFETGNILTMQMSLSGDRYFQGLDKPERINAFLADITARIERLPGVRGVSYAQSVPLTSVENSTGFDIVEKPFPKGEQPGAQLRFIGLGYFETLGIPRLVGRDFTDRDDPQSPPVVIINEAFAREYFGGGNPIGRRLKLGWGGDAPKEIVGVVGNVRHRNLSDSARPEMYVPQSQFANAGITLLVRSSVRPESLIGAVKREIYALDPQLPITAIRTLDEYRSDAMALPRFSAFLLGLFSLVALLLTVVGLYGVVSYTVAQRRHEIGIRMALGAQRRDVLRLVIGQGMRTVATGVALGLALSLLLTRWIGSLLYGVTATDPLTFAGIALLLAMVALAACILPARRAAQVDPVVALRE